MTVAGLTVHSLLFNISGFFQGGGLGQMLASFSGMPELVPNSQSSQI
jgi:hypothetical protein